MRARKKPKRSLPHARSVVQCPTCCKWYSSKKSLKIHLRIHTGCKPYSCNLCPKQFSQANVLKAHINAHLGRRDYVCDICHKAFVQSAHLRTHRQIHSKTKDYSCPYCSKSFCSKSIRDRHCRLHTGEKPYICIFCLQSFSHREAMKAHEVSRHQHAYEDFRTDINKTSSLTPIINDYTLTGCANLADSGMPAPLPVASTLAPTPSSTPFSATSTTAPTDGCFTFDGNISERASKNDCILLSSNSNTTSVYSVVKEHDYNSIAWLKLEDVSEPEQTLFTFNDTNTESGNNGGPTGPDLEMWLATDLSELINQLDATAGHQELLSEADLMEILDYQFV